MRFRGILIAILGCLTLAIPTVSHAATFTSDMLPNGGSYVWVPTPQHTTAGETINWTWTGGHSVSKYSGDGAAFSAPVKNGGSYSNVFGGGQVWFRCTLHGFLSDGGACQGMCGSYTDRTTAPGTPSFSSPAPGSTVASTFTLSGTAEPSMLILVRQGTTVRARAQSSASGAWSSSVTPAPGAVTLIATAYDAEGRASGSTSISYTVVADSQDPSVVITQPENNELIVRMPSESQWFDRVIFTGTASDDTGIRSVQVNVYALGVAQVIGPGYNFAVCDACSFPTGPGQTISWTFKTEGFVPGSYTAVAVATDRVGHITESAAVSFTYIGVSP